MVRQLQQCTFRWPFACTVVLLMLVGFYRVAPLSGRHYHLYLRFVTLFALCNGHVMTVGPKTIIYFFDQH